MGATAGSSDNLAFGTGGKRGGEVGSWVEEVCVPYGWTGRFRGSWNWADGKTALALLVATNDVGVTIDREEDGVAGRVGGEDALHANIGH